MTIHPPGSGILTVSAGPDWRLLPDSLPSDNARLWALSTEVRENFGENLVESWGTTEADDSPRDLVSELEQACASLPDWRPIVNHSWSEGGDSYVLVSGFAAVGVLTIESTSVLGIRADGGTVSAHQAVVTTFAGNRDRHVAALRRVRSASSTVAEHWYG